VIAKRSFIFAIFAATLALGGGAAHLPGQTPSPSSIPLDLNDKGSFAVSFAGHPLGTEKFVIRSSSTKIEADAEIELKSEQAGQTVNIKSNPKLVLSPQFEPQTYVINQKGAPEFHLEVDFHTSPAKSKLRLANKKEDDVREFALTKDVVVLDDNVINHYQLLVDRFAQKSDKQQTFNAYTPQEAVPGVLDVQDIGSEEVDVAGKKEMMRHLVVSTELARVDLWVDAQHHLQRILIPAIQLEGIRTK
jgi:hypothetical protein